MECFEFCCQSPRPTIWSSLLGLGIEYVSFPQGSVEIGTYFSSPTAGALKRAGLMKLFGNGTRVTGSTMVRATPLDWHAAEASALKSPLIVACVGTKASDCGGAVRSRVPW